MVMGVTQSDFKKPKMMQSELESNSFADREDLSQSDLANVAFQEHLRNWDDQNKEVM